MATHWARGPLVSLLSGLLMTVCVQAQEVPQGSEPQAAPPAVEPPSGNRPGFLDALGRFFGQSREVFDSQLKSTQDTIGTLGSQAKDAAGAAGQAAGSVIALPGTRIVNGRQLCPVAANGAPDCQQGAVALCRDKGFQGGARHLDIATSQRCPIKSWISGKGPKDADCRIENYVTRAVCQ